MHGQEHKAKMLAKAIKGPATVKGVMSSKKLSKEQKRAVLRELRKTASRGEASARVHAGGRVVSEKLHKLLKAVSSASKGRRGALAAIAAGAAGLTGFALTGKEDKKEKLKKHGQASNLPLVTANVTSRMGSALKTESPFKRINPKTPGTMANPPKPKVSATKRWIYKTFMKD